MMARSLPLRIATPEQLLLEEQVLGLRASAVEGQLGVLAGHAPMIAELTIGELVVRPQSGEPRHFATTGGVLRVERDGATVLADAAEEAERIDVERARAALERAQQRLRGPRATPGMDLLRAELALARALNRLRVATRLGPRR
jgi:F-type H+-transporting ATPase subunit epsilon